MGPNLKRATEYLRVSRDTSGRLRSVDEQDRENRRAAEERGWQLLDPYVEADARSASRYARRARPGFDRLVADLERGRFHAEVLILWEPSRGSRRLSEWARFLELLEQRGVRLHVTSHGRTYDLANPRDRRSLHEDGTDSEYESAKVSQRARRAQAAQAAAGLPNGKAPFGYRRIYDTEGRGKGRFRQVIHEPEAEVVRELFSRLAAGHSLRSIAVDLERRGVRSQGSSSRGPRPLSVQVLRGMAQRRAYIGERVHRPADGPETITTAAWPPIVDLSTWRQVQARLERSRAAHAPRSSRAKHLLTMIARCDPCGGPLAVSYRKDRGPSTPAQYYCRDKGCVRITQADVDEIAEGVMLGVLARPGTVDRLTAPDDDAVGAAREEVARLQVDLDQLYADVETGAVSPTIATRRERGLLAQLEAARARESELTTPAVLRGLIEPGADVAHRWAAAELSTRREVARLLLVPELLGELRVARSPSPGHRCPAQDRLVWRTEP